MFCCEKKRNKKLARDLGQGKKIINKSIDSHNFCKKKSHDTRGKKIVNFVSDPRASTTPGTHALANNRRFPPFKTKERNQHASSVGIECLTIEFDQEQIFGTDETFFKIFFKESRACEPVCVRYLRYYVSSVFHATCIFFSFQRRFHVCFQFEYFLSSFAYRLLSDGCGRSMQICLVHTSGRVRSKIETCDNMNKINTMRRFETPKSRAPGKLNKTMKNSNRY